MAKPPTLTEQLADAKAQAAAANERADAAEAHLRAAPADRLAQYARRGVFAVILGGLPPKARRIAETLLRLPQPRGDRPIHDQEAGVEHSAYGAESG